MFKKPQFDILPDQSAAEMLYSRGCIIAEYNAALEGNRSPDYDSGKAFKYAAGVQHGEFLRNCIAAISVGWVPDETTLALMLDSATQFWASSLHDLSQVGNGPWAE